MAPPAVVYGDFTQASGERAVNELLRLRPDLDGVFAANDHMALGALRALSRAGRRVPDDVAVIGFDDIEPGRHAEPPLTTVAQDSVAQARLMVKLVLAQRDGHGDPGGHILPTRLVVRGSG
jgi:DNA-binding LacI/PurR family transcriptional regulator